MNGADIRPGFTSDYMKGAHPALLKRLTDTNFEKTPGYGRDLYSDKAREKIRSACACDGALVEFLVGGTQTNALIIDAFLRPYEGVIAADTGHISVHESGAVEACGHKVLTIPQKQGKISASDVRTYLKDFYANETYEHMVIPGMVYISQPTEYGTLYSKEELFSLSAVCREYGIPLYADGARLAYALASRENDVTLPDLARACDAFYIGGTKCGALFGEAAVFPDPSKVPHFFTMIKQHGALLAKGRLLGLQFDALFTDGLYQKIGENAMIMAEKIRDALTEKGYPLCFGSVTNQTFTCLENSRLEKLARDVDFEVWEKWDDDHTVIRLATDWGTTEEEVETLIRLL